MVDKNLLLVWADICRGTELLWVAKHLCVMYRLSGNSTPVCPLYVLLKCMVRITVVGIE